MRKHLSTPIVLAAAALVAPFGAAAGTVEVTFAHETTPFTDIGRSSVSQRDALAALKRHFESLGKRLPATQTLSIEVTDVDLAGEEKWTRNASDLRVLRGRADWPRIELRYTLSDGGRTVRQATDAMSDMAYLMASHGVGSEQPYAYERRMIDRWFSEKIAGDTVAKR